MKGRQRFSHLWGNLLEIKCCSVIFDAFNYPLKMGQIHKQPLGMFHFCQAAIFIIIYTQSIFFDKAEELI